MFHFCTFAVVANGSNSGKDLVKMWVTIKYLSNQTTPYWALLRPHYQVPTSWSIHFLPKETHTGGHNNCTGVEIGSLSETVFYAPFFIFLMMAGKTSRPLSPSTHGGCLSIAPAPQMIWGTSILRGRTWPCSMCLLRTGDAPWLMTNHRTELLHEIIQFNVLFFVNA